MSQQVQVKPHDPSILERYFETSTEEESRRYMSLWLFGGIA